MTDEEQFAIINTRQWYTDMRTQCVSILGAMQTVGFSINGGTIATTVQGVAVNFALSDGGQDVHAQVAQQADGSWMYDWHFPAGWVAPDAPAPVVAPPVKVEAPKSARKK